MSYRAFVHEIARRTDVADITEVEHVVLATLIALGERLRDVDARAVASQLPASLAAPILAARHTRDAIIERTDVESFERRIAPTNPRLVRAVCRLLAESLDEQARAHLRMQPLTALFS